MEDLETEIFNHVVNPFPPRERNEQQVLFKHGPMRVAESSHFRLYSTYTFAKLDSADHLSMRDRASLELSGCLYLPQQSQLYDFFVHYFRYIHPYLPMLDESRFWQIYSGGEIGEDSTISLFVLQAMLFATVSLVDRSTITGLGFLHYEEARDTFYERAKTLFELRAESDSLSIAQGTLLLSFRFAMNDPKCNVGWLGRAVSHARICGAHLPNNNDIPDSKTLQYRRLWCSCIIRDRILSLGIRTRLLIPPAEYDPLHDLLTEQDLSSEVATSRVYSASSKKTLVYLSVKLSQLTGILTEIATLAEDVKDVLRGVRDLAANTAEIINRAKDQLDAWGDVSLDHVLQQREESLSVMSYATLVFIFYQSSRIRLANAQIMLLQIQNRYISPEIQLKERQEIKKVLEQSVHTIVQLMQNAVKHDVVGHWPISIGAHVFFPAMLLYINRMLPTTPLEMVNRVNGYRDALTLLQCSQSRFGVAEKALQHLTATLEEDLEALLFAGHDETMSAVTGWSDLVVHSPNVYLKLVLVVENFFERGVVV